MPGACGRERKNEKRGCARNIVVGGQAEMYATGYLLCCRNSAGHFMIDVREDF